MIDGAVRAVVRVIRRYMGIKINQRYLYLHVFYREEMAPRGRNREAVSGGISDIAMYSQKRHRYKMDIDVFFISMSFLSGVIQISKAIIFYMTPYRWNIPTNIKSG